MNNSQGIYKSESGKQLLMNKYDAILQKVSFQFTPHTVHTCFGNTFLIQSGKQENPPLLLLHGASSNLLSWLGEIPSLNEYFNVIAVDVIGEPGKSDQTRLDYQSQDYAIWLEEIIYHLGLKKVSLMGISQGGWLSLQYTVHHPEKVNKLVLISPAGISHTKLSFILKAILYSMSGKSGVKKLNRYVIGPEKIDQDAEAFMELVQTHVIQRFSKEYLFTDEELKRFIMPVLLVGGDKDVVRSNQAIADRLRVLLPNFSFLLLPGVGHVIPSVSDKVIPFLQPLLQKEHCG
ncbi:MAG: alpha/beta hydrolase [Caldisericia bacterium]|nr:alpha/beta hydrolase [Caldisericia bacterium]